MNIKEIENFVESTESLSNYIEELGEAYKELDMLSSESYNSTVLQEKYLNVLNVYNNARGAIGLKPDSITHEAFSRSPYMSLAVTKEGIFSAIGDFFKKIWEWIKKIFKSIKEFLFGSSEDKAEEAKEEAEDVKKLIEKLRNRDLKDREFILEDLDKNSLLIKGKNNYGPLGIMFKRAEYNISYKVVADNVRKFLEDMEGYFKFADREYGALDEIAKPNAGSFGGDIIRTCRYAFSLYENYNDKIKNFKLYEKFDKFQDCLEEDFKNDPVVSELESSFIVTNGREEFVIGKNARAHLTYLTAETAWKLYTIDTTDEHKKYVNSLERVFTEKAASLAADIDSGTSRHLAETEKGSDEYVIKSVHSALAFSNRSMLKPVKGYKLKSKEIDALKSYVTNKENLLNFLKVYSDFLMTIDVKSYTEVGNRIDRISKLVDNSMEKILKKHSSKQHGAVIKFLSETAKNNDRTYEYFKHLANMVKTKVGDLAKFSMILKNEISIFSSDLKFDNISKLISSLFKEGSESVSSESYIRENVAPKLSFSGKAEKIEKKEETISSPEINIKDLLRLDDNSLPEQSTEANQGQQVPVQQPAPVAPANNQQPMNNQQGNNGQNTGLINNITAELKGLVELFNNVIKNMKTRLTTESVLSFENGNVKNNGNNASKNENITKVFNEVANNFNAKLREINKNFLAINKYNSDLLNSEILTNFTNKIKSLKNELTTINSNINSIPKTNQYSEHDKTLVHNIANRIKNVEESLLKDPIIKEVESKSASAHKVKKVDGNPYQVALKIADDLIVKFYKAAISRIVKETPNVFPTDDSVYVIINEEYDRVIDELRKIVKIHRGYSGQSEDDVNYNDYTGLLSTWNENRALANSLESGGWENVKKFMYAFVKLFDNKACTDRSKLESYAISIFNELHGNKPVKVNRESFSEEVEEVVTPKPEVKKVTLDFSKILR